MKFIPYTLDLHHSFLCAVVSTDALKAHFGASFSRDDTDAETRIESALNEALAHDERGADADASAGTFYMPDGSVAVQLFLI